MKLPLALLFICFLNSNYIHGQNEVTLSMTEKQTYKLAIENLLTDSNVRKGLAQILGKRKIPKKFLNNGKPKFRISQYLYTNVTLGMKSDCIEYTNSRDEESFISSELSFLSNDIESKKNYLIYFSKIHSNYLECKILKNCKNDENSFYSNTRFGNILIIQYCLEENKIVDIAVSAVIAN